MDYEGNVIRPPAEARSVILQVTVGCSHNRCAFCGTYPYPFRVKSMERVLFDLDEVQNERPKARRFFLADGNVLGLPHDRLVTILQAMAERFPKLSRIGVYGTAKDVAAKSDAELQELWSMRLRCVYIGLESGSDRVLAAIGKGATAEDMIRAVHRVQEAGIRASVMALLGLGGRKGSQEHAIETGRVLSQMNARYTSLLALMLLPGTPLFEDAQEGRFQALDDEELLRELRLLLQNLDCEQSVFRANHASNPLALEGRLPQDKARLLAEVDEALEGRLPLRPSFFRRL